MPQTRRGLMAVVVKIPTQLRAAAGGEAETEVDGATVQEVLDGLFERHDELRARLYDDDGACGASSTSTSPGKTSAFSTAWRRPSRTARSFDDPARRCSRRLAKGAPLAMLRSALSGRCADARRAIWECSADVVHGTALSAASLLAAFVEPPTADASSTKAVRRTSARDVVSARASRQRRRAASTRSGGLKPGPEACRGRGGGHCATGAHR